MKNASIRLAVASTFALFAAIASAQEFPSKPLHILVPFGPGGPTDLANRAIADKLKDGLKQPVIVDNKPGAGSLVAAEGAARAAPDGHTILAAGGTMFILPHLQPISIDLFKDLAPISKYTSIPLVIAGRVGAPFRTLPEMIAYAKANPGKLTAGVSGYASHDHIGLELLAMKTGFKFTAVPFKGTALIIPEMLAGRVDINMSTPSAYKAQVDAGKIVYLAATPRTRIAILPDVPTVAESGSPGYDLVSWGAFYTTGGTPRPIIARLDQEIRTALQDKATAEKMIANGYYPDYLGTEALAALAKKESDEFREVVRVANIKTQ